MNDVKWWQFWDPMSGFLGGAFFGTLLALVLQVIEQVVCL